MTCASPSSSSSAGLNFEESIAQYYGCQQQLEQMSTDFRKAMHHPGDFIMMLNFGI